MRTKVNNKISLCIQWHYSKQNNVSCTISVSIMTQIEEFSLGRGVLASLDVLNFSIRHNLNPRASFSWPCSEMFLQMERDKSFLQGEQFCLLVVARIGVFVANYFKYKLIKTKKCFLWLRFAICVKIPDLVSQRGG